MPSPKRIFFFQPGHLIYRVRHKTDAMTDQQLEALRDWTLRTASSQNFGPSVRFPSSKTHLRFTPPESVPELSFTLLPAEIDPVADGPDDLRALARLSAALNSAQHMDALRRDERFAGAQLEVAALNWLGGGGQNLVGGGGPGGKPDDEPSVKLPKDYTFKFPALPIDLTKNQGKGVTVAVLDTAPSEEALTPAKIGPLNNSFLNELLNGAEPLQVHRLLTPAPARLDHYELRGHDYVMSDHGLFVAGVIHSIAPLAEIHLYEVLNKFGVGDSLSILQGLHQVYQDLPRKRLVINCSLYLCVPNEEGHSKEGLEESVPPEGDSSWHLQKSLGDWLDQQGSLTEPICKLFRDYGGAMVASAGNDARANQATPQARFPAAFDSVLGVGALRRGSAHEHASYSNIADEPPLQGIATFGGDTGHSNGMLGLYVGDIPNGSGGVHPSANGWARWAGTSFAAPVVSGAVAALLSDPALPDTAAAMQKLFDGTPQLTGLHEVILDAVQGN